MIIVLKPGTSREQADEILGRIAGVGCKPLYMPGVERTVIGAIGDERAIAGLQLQGYPQVESITPVLAPYKLVSREMHPHDTIIAINDVSIGGGHVVVIAGPCAVESRDQLFETAAAVSAAGASCLRGGAFKPRTSPYSFQGLGLAGLELLAECGRALRIPTVTEVVEPDDVDAVAERADVLQVGARNMQNYALLRAVGQASRPVILKRGMSATLKELLLAAEYIMSEGNANIILCERGIRTYESAMRNTLDLSAVPYLRRRSHLPVIVDPSHGTGVRELVAPMALAALACGADGLMIEVHRDPARALSDGEQSLFPAQFAALMDDLHSIAIATGRTLARRNGGQLPGAAS